MTNPVTPEPNNPQPTILGQTQETPQATPPAPESPLPASPEFVPYTDEGLQIQLPEGATLDGDLKKGFVSIANELKLPKEAVDKFVSLQTESVKRAIEKQAADWNAVQEDWRKQVETHPKFGGEKLAPALGKISEFINTNSSDPNGFRKAIDDTGLGNHPLVVELLLRAAETVSEGKPTQGNPAGGPRDLASALYPTMKGN